MGNSIGNFQTVLLNHMIVITSNAPKITNLDDKTFIRKHKIMMENDQIDEKEFEACDYVLIRHALSQMNYNLE